MQLPYEAFESLVPKYKLRYNSSGIAVDERYPDCIGGVAIALQTDETMFTFLLTANYVTDRLYFRILSSEGSYVTQFRPVASYPANLVANMPEFSGYYCYLHSNYIYFGRFDEAE